MSPAGPQGAAPRVLIVDDSASVVRLLQFVFESEHYQVDTATDGQEALDKLTGPLPDVIVTDSIMPGVDGFALLARLKDQPHTSHIPVIMLTSEDPATSDLKGRTPQPDALVRKSADLGPLLRQVTEVLSRR